MLGTPEIKGGREEEKEEEKEEREREEVKEEEIEEDGWKVAYQNVGRGIETTNILLERGRQQKWDFVFVAEAWEGKKGERTTQQGYRTFSRQGSKIALYVREEVILKGLQVDVGEDWIAVGDWVAGVYLSPNTNVTELREILNTIPPTDNVIGDLNCTQRYKRRALLDHMHDRALGEKPVKGNTWRRWIQPRACWVESKPDVIFSTGNWITHEKEWTISDHAIISSTIQSQVRKRKLLVTDWEAWADFIEDEDKEATYLDPITSLKTMAKETLKPKKFSPKPWWDAEVKQQRKITRRAGRHHGEWRSEAAKLRNMIKKKKREHWASFVEETVSNKSQDIWQVIRVARNPFNRKTSMPTKLDENCETDNQKAKAFIDHHFQGSEEDPVHDGFLCSMKGVPKQKDELMAKLHQALSNTNSNSTPGPDRISYCLLKQLKDTRLGTQIIGILADFLGGKKTILSGTGDGREITVVMIPKPGKDSSKAKGWRPIVLINCLLKLMDKVVASELQTLPVFHHGQYGSRKGKNAMDMVIQATSEAQLERSRGQACAWALGDIKSAFNYTRKANVIDRLATQKAEGLVRYIHWFYQPRMADITWDGETRASAITIKSGVPQGSPLSPVLFLVGVAKAFDNADMRIQKEITSHRVNIYSYVDDFNCTTEKLPSRHPGRQPEAITVAKKARAITSEELEKCGWTRDPDKDEEINFGIQGEAKWVGVHFTQDLKWKKHCSKRLAQAEAAWACISRLGTSRGGLSPGTWRQVYTSSIRAIATYGWELVDLNGNPALERLRKLQYQAVRKVTGGYHGSRQELLENISKVEPVQTKIWDMKVRAAARILEKGIQGNLIFKTEETRRHAGG